VRARSLPSSSPQRQTLLRRCDLVLLPVAPV